MEIESQIESRGKGSGWYGERMKHSLCARGYKLKSSGDAKLAKMRALSEENDLTWDKFQMLYQNEAEEKLEEMINDGAAELEGDELEEGQRVWKNQTLLEIDEDGEVKKIVIDGNTLITIIK